MAVAQGACPSCGAPMTFGVGASMSQVCKYCRHVVVRTDRDLRTMGKIADLTMTPSPVAVGDTGTIDGAHMTVQGRVQLDHGAGPWDEWYIAFSDGRWAWLAYAQGNWYVTAEAAVPPLPAWDQVTVEMDLQLGAAGTFRVAEVKKGTITSGEGELPFVVTPGQTRYYADLQGPNGAFATIDYGDRTGPPTLFTGFQRPEGALVVKPMGERAVTEVATDAITCPNCGGNVPALAPKKSERLGCPYCGAVSEIATRRVLEQQQAARMRPDIPLGSQGTISGQHYVVCGYVERSATIEGEHFSWQEYLLYGQGLGFRWLVKDESTWLWVNPISIAEVDLRSLPRSATYGGRTFRLRNQNPARVDYVLGEFYWKVAVGETVQAMDLTNGKDVLSRERAGDEVAWSLCTPVAWAALAQAFGLAADGAGGRFAPSSGGGGGGDYGGSDYSASSGETSNVTTVIILIVVVLVILVMCGACGGCGGCGGGTGGGFWGGSWGGGSRGGK